MIHGTYRKKPVFVEAWQIPPNDGVVRPGPPPWLSQKILDGAVWVLTSGGVSIPTGEGVWRGGVGDWIIQSEKGDLSTCEADVFAASYEMA